MARATVSQDVAAALYAEFGSERAAARAAGVARSTFHDALIGRFEGRTLDRTAGAFERAAREVGDTVIGALTGLLRSLGGGDVRAGARQVAPQSRRSPGVARRQAAQYQQRMREVGLTPDGRPLPPPMPSPSPERPEYDSRGRRITDRQWETYQELRAAYQSGSLTQDQYGRFLAMQLDTSEDSLFSDVADL